MNRFLSEVMSNIPGVEKEYFDDLFSVISSDQVSGCQPFKVEKDKQIVEIHEEIDKIWILLHGSVKAIDEYASGDKYIFKSFPAPEVFGEMEILAGMEEYRASLVTETDCYFVILSPGNYVGKLGKSPEYVLKRLKSISESKLNEERIYRSYLRVQGIDRLKLYMVKLYEFSKSSEEFVLNKSRQEIADETGYSIRTVNRIIKQLKEEGFMSGSGNKIKISKDQYSRMLKTMDKDNYF